MVPSLTNLLTSEVYIFIYLLHFLFIYSYLILPQMTELSDMIISE
jgi:hypothetical protein